MSVSSESLDVEGIEVWEASRVCVETGEPETSEPDRGYRLGRHERETIALGVARGLSVREIARQIGRSVSTVSREIVRNRCEDGSYRAFEAVDKAEQRAKRPKPSKLACAGGLRDYVSRGLDKKLSPEQIAHRIRLDHPDDQEMRVCHETIYQALYVEARGGLKREVVKALRTGRANRKPHGHDNQRTVRITGGVSISERPGEVEDRVVPGHFEGDLIIGKNSQSAVATVVERVSRLLLLGCLENDHSADTVGDALVPVFKGLPDMMRRSMTWDQGSEMACHFHLAEQAGIDIYFADPHSPWQRGTNENTNGLLRQYMPKGTDLSIYTREDLQAIADELNNRPRKVLGWLTPLEVWHLLLGHTVIVGGRPAQLPDTLKPLAQRQPSSNDENE